jgi:hypothetical protein
MSATITFNLNLSKLDKSKIVQGKKGSYYPLTVFVNDNTDPYGNNVAVATGLTKEEREAGAKTEYISNGKVIKTDGSVSVAERVENNAPAQKQVQEADFPF